jgi:hopanoid biosynthesis associated RND transporter like protein HpnN
MVTDWIIRLVEACRRHARLVAPGLLATGVICGLYGSTHLGLDTDADNLISQDLPWRRHEAEFDRAFPARANLVVVIDAQTPDQAEDAAARLAARLGQRTDLFRSVRVPGQSDFFRRNGLLFLGLGKVRKIADQLIQAQPVIGTLAAEPTLRGLFRALDLAAKGVTPDRTALATPSPGKLDRPFAALAGAVEAALAGKPRPLSWQELLTGRTSGPGDRRSLILLRPVLDYAALQPGARVSAFIRATAERLALIPANGVRVRLTGTVVLNDEQFATVTRGAGLATLLSLVLVGVILFLALRSLRLVVAIFATLLVGLATTFAFAALAVGSLNIISVAFAVLFVGIAVDFGIQFSVRYRDERYRRGAFDAALRAAAGRVGGPLTLAAAATTTGFLALTPTPYVGVAELGLIAGIGMIVALAFTLTLLPALLTLLQPAGERAAVGFAWAAPIDTFLLRQRRSVIALSAMLGLTGLALLPQLRFDFDPLDLQDAHSESVATLFDLMKDPTTSPYMVEVLSPAATAGTLAGRLEALPEVSRVIALGSFVPERQKPKLAALSEVRTLFGPTLSPPHRPPPDPAAERAAIARFAADLKRIAGPPGSPSARLLADLDNVLGRGPAVLPALRASLLTGLERLLDDLRLALSPRPITAETLPTAMARRWIAADGRHRIEVFPRGNMRDPRVFRRFVTAVLRIAPEATGPAITIWESGRTVVRAFVHAGIIAIAAIAALLILVLRRVRDVILVLTPLLLAGLLTALTSIAIGLPLNYANIIALPLLFGVGVGFDIYFVMNWRNGAENPLQSSTARAVLFSALTTMTAFGSLALSGHPGTASMGELLSIALFYALFCTLLVLPALLGRPATERPVLAARRPAA